MFEKTLRWSGGKPPFLTCELAGLEPSFWMLTFKQSRPSVTHLIPAFETTQRIGADLLQFESADCNQVSAAPS
jgi:hypothetical protein